MIRSRSNFEAGDGDPTTTFEVPDTSASSGSRYNAGPMPRRPVCLVLLLILAGLACSPEGGAPPETVEGPLRLAGSAAGRDVVLVTVDTVRADRLGSYGYSRPDLDTSPQIDALLTRGARFERAMAPRSLTWPSLATVLTGLYPASHGVIENGYELPEGVVTLAESLGAAGYRTGAFLSNMCKANHQGWDALSCTGGQDGKTIDRAVGWVREGEAGEDGDAPYFLWVHLFAAHGPYYNGGDRAARLDPSYDGPLGPKKWQLDRVMMEPLELSPRDVEYLDTLYDAAVAGTDGLVGRLLEGLGVPSEEAVVVFLADHGEDLYDHNGYLYHACSPYQSSLHVPLGMVAPGLVPERLEIPQVVELGDVAPTLLDLLGLPWGPDAPDRAEAYRLDGVSLLPLLGRHAAGSPPAGPGKPAYSEYSGLPIHTVLDGDWKLVSNPEGVEPFCIVDAPPGHYPLRREELYDLSRDPEELDDLAASHPEQVQRLREMIRQRYRNLTGKAEQQELDPRLKEELEALGYVAN